MSPRERAAWYLEGFVLFVFVVVPLSVVGALREIIARAKKMLP